MIYEKILVNAILNNYEISHMYDRGSTCFFCKRSTKSKKSEIYHKDDCPVLIAKRIHKENILEAELKIKINNVEKVFKLKTDKKILCNRSPGHDILQQFHSQINDINNHIKKPYPTPGEFIKEI